MSTSVLTETAEARRTRNRCRYVELVIDGKRARLDPVIAADGQLNSLQSIGPTTPGGGYTVAVVEVVHGSACPAVAGGPCDCGGQTQLEQYILHG